MNNEWLVVSWKEKNACWKKTKIQRLKYKQVWRYLGSKKKIQNKWNIQSKEILVIFIILVGVEIFLAMAIATLNNKGRIINYFLKMVALIICSNQWKYASAKMKQNVNI